MPPRSLPLLLSLALGACSFGSGKKPNETRDSGMQTVIDSDVPIATRSEVVSALATNVILPSIVELETASIALETALQAYAAAPSDTVLRDAARDEWRAFSAVWQQSQVVAVGPLGLSTDTLGGLSIRDEIDSWPLLNRCGVDTETAAQSYADVDAFAAKPANRRGVLAIEYLLFASTTTHHCDSTFDATWASVSDLGARRAAYASTLTTLIHRQATRLRQQWEPTGSNFIGNFTGTGNLYPGVNEALNAISDALFYVEIVVKDQKIAIATGFSPLCASSPGPCPDSVESRFARASLAHIRNNLVGFRRVIVGGTPGNESAPGFDDLLLGIGQRAVADELITDIDAAIAFIDGLTVPLETLVVTDATNAMGLYNVLKALSDVLKGELTGLLDLSVPAAAAGDND